MFVFFWNWQCQSDILYDKFHDQTKKIAIKNLNKLTKYDKKINMLINSN